MNVIEINEKEAAAKLSLVNKYFQIILSIVFGVCIFYLYKGQLTLNDRLFQYVNEDKKTLINVVNENTNVQKETLILNKETNRILLENQTYFKQSKK